MRVPAISCGAALLAAFLIPLTATSQATGVLEGIVVDASTGRSLEGVRLAVVGTALTHRTDAHGTFRFAEVPAGDVVLRAERDGYVSFTDRVQIQEGRIFSFEIHMETLDWILDELRVLARRTPSAPVRAAADHRSLPDALATSGVVTVFRPGIVGGTSRFLIRGPKSLVGRNAPAVFVDGVRVAEPEGGFYGGVTGPSILDVIPAESIDSIRVLRGPSAAAMGGSDTANGVILVYTKRGG